MKLILLFTVAALSAFAQTNTVRVFTTNYVAAAWNFREVNGQLYNVMRSSKAEHGTFEFQRQVNGLALFTKLQTAGNGDDISVNVMVTNYPPQNTVTGQRVLLDVIRIGTAADNEGHVAELCDYGTPHLVPVVTSKIMRLP